MSKLWFDLRHGVRVLVKNPGFTAVAVLALALGIGANSAIFSVVNAVLLRPLPFKDADRLVMLWESEPQLKKAPVLSRNFLDWKEQNQVFDHIAAYADANFTLVHDESPERVKSARVSSTLFDLLNVAPVIGRTFRPEEDVPGSNRVVIIGHNFWRNRFGANPSIVGQALLLNGENFTVVGVLPADFHFIEPTELWVPIALTRENSNQQVRDLKVFARIKPGISFERAQAEMNALVRNTQQQYPDISGQVDVKLVALQDELVGDVRLSLLVLFGAVGFVLLIACANVANLLLSRTTRRRREIAIRLALGATRSRIIRQLLTESVMLALLGGMVGLPLAFLGKNLLRAGLNSASYSGSYIDKIGLDWRVLIFTLAACVLTGIAFGLTPALYSIRQDLNTALKSEGRGVMAGFRHNRLSGLLVILEVSIALVLLIGAGLMIKSFLRLQHVELGFNPDNALTMRIALPPSKYKSGAEQISFFEQVTQRIRALPGVRYASAINNLPLSKTNLNGVFLIEGREPWVAGNEPLAEFRMVTNEYFSAMEIPLLKGRTFSDGDTEKSPGVVVINNAMARQFWRGEDPVGNRLRLGRAEDAFPYLMIVGVVGDVKHFGPNREARPEVYIPYPQYPLATMSLLVRTEMDPAGLAAPVRAQVQAVDPSQPVYNMTTMESLLAESVAQPRLYVKVLGAFAVIAIVLAAVGIYSVISYSINQRRREIAIRMALGAQPHHVLKTVIRQGMILALTGVLVGAALAFILTRFLSSLLYGVSSTDPLTFVGISFLLSSVAFFASYLPARKVTQIDPVATLRNE